VLSYSRAEILKDCAQVALHARAYDLLVFSQTVPDAAVKEIMASAVNLHPDARFLLFRKRDDNDRSVVPRSRPRFSNLIVCDRK
jgi:hypothetical protein